MHGQDKTLPTHAHCGIGAAVHVGKKAQKYDQIKDQNPKSLDGDKGTNKRIAKLKSSFVL